MLGEDFCILHGLSCPSSNLCILPMQTYCCCENTERSKVAKFRNHLRYEEQLCFEFHTDHPGCKLKHIAPILKLSYYSLLYFSILYHIWPLFMVIADRCKCFMTCENACTLDLLLHFAIMLTAKCAHCLILVQCFIAEF